MTTRLFLLLLFLPLFAYGQTEAVLKNSATNDVTESFSVDGLTIERTTEYRNAKTDYDASGSIVTTTGTVGAGSTSLVVASGSTWSVGHGIAIVGAGTAGAVHRTTVTAISGTNFTLNDAAVTGVTGAVVRHDDTTALQSALDSVYDIFIPSGNYNHTGRLTASVRKRIIGAGEVERSGTSTGAGTALFQQSGTSGGILISKGWVELAHMSLFTGTGVTATAGTAIEVSGTNSTIDRSHKVHDITSAGYWQALKVGTSVSAGHYYNLDMRIINGATDGMVYYDNSTPAGDNKFYFCDFDVLAVSGTQNAPTGIRIVRSDVTSWDNVKVSSANNALLIDGSVGVAQAQRFANCSFENGTGAVSLVKIANTANVRGVSLVNCEIGTTTSGTGVEIGAAATGISIVGCRFQDLTLGISLNGLVKDLKIDPSNIYYGVTTKISNSLPSSAIFGAFLDSNLGIYCTDASASNVGSSLTLGVLDGTALGSGHRLGVFSFGGSTTTTNTPVNPVAISAYATENWVNSSAYGTEMRFEGTLDGATTRAEWAKFNNADLIWSGTNKGPVIRSPDGNRWRIVVDNSGALSTTDLDP